jgi:hypothetical protein
MARMNLASMSVGDLLLEEFAIQSASSGRKQVAAKRGRPGKKRRAKK